jgi:hypothetical protein
LAPSSRYPMNSCLHTRSSTACAGNINLVYA